MICGFMTYTEGLTLRLYNDCIHNIARENSTVLSRETLVFLIGKPVGDKLIGKNSHVFSSVNGSKTTLNIATDAEMDRFIEYDKTLREQAKAEGKRPFTVIGAAHSHPYGFERSRKRRKESYCPRLHSYDIESVEYYMNRFEKNNWVELIVNTKRVKYSGPYHIGTLVYSYPRRLRIISRNRNREGFDMIYVAYYLWKEKNRLRKMEIPVDLAESFI